MIRIQPPLFIAGLVFAAGLSAQAPKIDVPAPSPAATVKQRVGLTDVEVDYSRPGVKGRVIFGHLVPYGKVWRTGANSETRIRFSTAVKLNGIEIPAGTYGLFTIPGETEWTVIIDKSSKMWGAYTYDPKDDLVRFKATPVALADPVETFGINFTDIQDTSANINLEWDRVRVPLKLEVEFVPQVLAQIDAAMASNGEKPYAAAAMFYLQYGKDLKMALGWVNAAIAQKPSFNLSLLRARILAKMGDKDGALASAKEAIELANKSKLANDSRATAADEYIRLSNDLIDTLR